MITHYILLGLIDGAGPVAQPEVADVVPFNGRGIEAAHATHYKSLRKRLPAHIERELLRQLRAQSRGEKRSALASSAMRLQLTERRPIDSSRSLLARGF